MQTQSSALARASVALALLLTMATTAAGRRPAGSHGPPPPSHGCSGQTMTIYTAGAPPPDAATAVAPSSRHAVFTSQGPLRHSGSWPRALTRPGALRPGALTVVDERFHGETAELGLPLGGSLRGFLVTSMEDNNSSSHMVALQASFAGDGAAAEDSLRFFGVHHDGREESHVAVVGGTGRYDGASGFAVVRAAGVPGTGGNASLSNALSFEVHLK